MESFRILALSVLIASNSPSSAIDKAGYLETAPLARSTSRHSCSTARSRVATSMVLRPL